MFLRTLLVERRFESEHYQAPSWYTVFARKIKSILFFCDSNEPVGQEPVHYELNGQEPVGREPVGQEPVGQEPHPYHKKIKIDFIFRRIRVYQSLSHTHLSAHSNQPHK